MAANAKSTAQCSPVGTDQFLVTSDKFRREALGLARAEGEWGETEPVSNLINSNLP